jgi:hypothetical protein
MSLKKWERDVLNRQRNIVFPDTNLNEGRFYRNIASGKATFSVGQKMSLLIIVLFVTIATSWGLAEAIASLMAQRDVAGRVIGLWGLHLSAGDPSFLDISRGQGAGSCQPGSQTPPRVSAIKQSLTTESNTRRQDFRPFSPKRIDHRQQRRRQQHSPKGNNDSQNDRCDQRGPERHLGCALHQVRLEK